MTMSTDPVLDEYYTCVNLCLDANPEFETNRSICHGRCQQIKYNSII